MTRALLTGLLVLLAHPGIAAATAIPPLDQAWFRPTLEQDHASICAELLQATQQAFAGPRVLLEALDPRDWREISPRESSQQQADGSQIHFAIYPHPGCGGGCEQYQIVTSTQPLAYLPNVTSEQLERSPQRSSNLPRLFVNAEQQVLSLSDDSTPSSAAHHLYLHQLNQDQSWTLACQIATAPQAGDSTAPAEIKTAKLSLDKLTEAMGTLAGGYGDCGSLRAGTRRALRIPEDLQLTLYRPWSLYAAETPYDPQRGFQSASNALDKWALTGLNEYRAAHEYRQALALAQTALAQFYTQANHWPQEQSERVAETALQAAVARALAFPSSGYEPFPDTEGSLRQAILQGRPVEEIRQIGGTLSDLSVAIEHPMAMRFLLEQGSDPDQRNPFGKTLLMYAAQHNQLETARLLLEAGADANATTIWPDDTCNYRLETSKMTALHYAVRYASPEMIDLLLRSGAVTFINSVSKAYQDGRTGSALQWFKRHTATTTQEPNPHITSEHHQTLEKALQVPSAEYLQRLARQLTLQAEREYADGRLAPAYRTLLLAREASPQDARLLGNLSLVAFKLGEHGPALEAGRQLIDSSQDARQLANAWFNQGLVCATTGWFSYNDHIYCRSGSIYAYYQAVSLESTAARQKQLLEQFRTAKGARCQIAYAEEDISILVQSDNRTADKGQWIGQTLYALYPSTIHLRPEDVSWQVKTQIIHPRAAGAVELGEWRLSVLESRESLGNLPLQIGSNSCHTQQQ